MTYDTELRQPLILILVALALSAPLLAGPRGKYNPYIPPTPEVTAASVKKAKEVLAGGKDDAKYLGAVQVILASELSEKEKHEVLAKLFLDKKRMLAFNHQTRRPSHYSDAYDSRNLVFQLCTEKLKDPAAFYTALSKDPAYDLAKTERREIGLHGDFYGALKLSIESKSPKAVEHFMRTFVLPLCKTASGWVPTSLSMLCKGGNGELLREALSEPKKWSVGNQMMGVPRTLAPFRTRYAVFEFLVNEYFRQDFNYYIRDCLLGTDVWEMGPRRVPLPGYDKVPDKDAAAYVKQIDRLLEIKDKLMKLEETEKTAENKEYPERWRRWTDKHVARLKEIREILAKKAEAFKNQQGHEE